MVWAVLLRCVVSRRADDVDPPAVGQRGGEGGGGGGDLGVSSRPHQKNSRWQQTTQMQMGVDHPLGVLQVTPAAPFHVHGWIHTSCAAPMAPSPGVCAHPRVDAKRRSAVSDGGEDQGAEEGIVHGADEGEEFITSVLERAVSRERLFLISASGESGTEWGLVRSKSTP